MLDRLRSPRSLLAIAALAALLGAGWLGFGALQAQTGAQSAPVRLQRYREGSAAFGRGDYAAARKQLEGLVYPPLAERLSLLVALSRGEGRRWIAEHPKSNLIPEALAHLSRQGERAALGELLRRYPDHPRSREAIEAALVATPDDRTLIAHLVRYFPESTLAYAMARRWEKLGGLSPIQWQAVAEVYRPVDPTRALQALGRAPMSAESLFARAQVLKRLGRKPEALALLEQLPRLYPTSPLTVDAALERAPLLPVSDALTLLTQSESAHPARGDELLWAQVQTVLKRLKAPDEALPLYRRLIAQYPQSAKAANAAWELAADAAEKGDLTEAQSRARWLIAHHPDDPFAPKAAFWLGKWAERSGATAQARRQFQSVLRQYPQSYYAWRAASRLGLVSGEYNIEALAGAVRWNQPLPPVSGVSLALAELMAIGDLDGAQKQWQAESYHRRLTPPLRLAGAQLAAQSGQYRQSINQSTLTLLASPPGDPRRWQQAYPLFFGPQLQRWSEERKLNPLLVASLIRQESRFEPAIRSRSGAVGLMQLLPSTARWIAQREPGAFDLDKVDDNLRLGTWYLRYTHERFGGSTLLALASYNAGPGNVSRWVQRTPVANPEDFIEQIPFRETRFYVVNIYENYWNYLRLYTDEGRRIAGQLPRSSG
ncbi:lytic transglycosylase catalytic subunit [Gloeobacter kilaueensis JS1]|uniref:Lytic transglycosylase catalytic subunit n=2 Tax=Gloeobacter TaxID=33071 RepID=U5QIY1_GLOK1|nr:lytic transglycosylase catalytic subunit [Gloeobacter kilaueensis JS1]